MTKLDVLSGLEKVKIGVGYQGPDGSEYDEPPMDPDVLETLEPVYEEVPGWTEDITGVRVLDELPHAAKHLLSRLQTLLEVPIALVSVGPKRAETIVVQNIYR